MIAKIEKANRPKYFTCNGVCVKIDNIVFVQKSHYMPYEGENKEACSVEIGIAGIEHFTALIPCKDTIDQTAIFTELTTILSAL